MRKISLFIVLLLLSVATYAQKEITGRVLNENGTPVENATVTVEKSSALTQTDSMGYFSLSVDADGMVTLSVRRVGYKTATATTDGTSALSIYMEGNANNLEDIIVVGYGTQREKDLTGSVATVSNKDFNQGPVLSPQQAMQGKLAGVNIALNSGKPGASNTVRIRGNTSLTGNNDPLYVIDGVPISTTAGVGQANIRGNGTDVFDQEPVNPLMTLNPDDIESITVLKDASAAAIYGSRAANGVIVITTKKGKGGNAQTSFSASNGYSNAVRLLKMLDADQYRAEAAKLGLTINDGGANTDWQDEIYRTAHLQDYNMAVSGGNTNTSYRASLGYGKQDGVMIGSSMDRANARLNINHKTLNDKLTFDLRTNYGRTFSNSAPVSNTVGSEAGTSMNYEAYVFNPTLPVFDSTGDYTDVPPYRVNPVSFSTEVKDQRTNTRFLGNLSTTYQIIKQLSFNVNLGYTNQTIDRNSYINKSNLLGQGLGGFASVQKLLDYSTLMENTLHFNEKFGKHTVDAIAGYSWQYFRNSGIRTEAIGFLSDEFKWYSLQAARTIRSTSTFESSNKLISFYGRLNYNFDDRFLVTATLRRDGSSRFGPENKWGYFPSGSVAWRLSQEDFFKVKAISDLKVRVSYGVTGNQEIGNLNSITTLGALTQGYIVGSDRITIVLPQQYANPNIKWEQTGQFDAGFDFGLFNNRLHGTFDFYSKKTTDLLLAVRVPAPTAISTQVANVGSVRNRGFEIALAADVVRTKKFFWESSVNFSRNVNEVLSLSNDQYKGDIILQAPTQGQGLSGGFAQRIMPGYPLGTFYGKVYTGLDEDGMETYADKDTVLGSAQPSFSFGFTNSISYGKFSLGFTLRGTVGNKIYNLTANNFDYLINLPGRNVTEEAVTSGVSREQPKVFSSRWIESGSFMRLDNITLSYTVNTKLKFFSNARVYVTGQNMFVITGYKGVDPEVNSEISATGVAPMGVDYLAYPKARSVTFGFSTNF